MSSSVLLTMYCLLTLGALIGPFVLYRIQQSNSDTDRIQKIYACEDNWGTEVCRTLVNREIKVGMTQDMVRLAVGPPQNIDQRESTDKYQQERWVYGVPRSRPGANYITFRDGKVSKTVINRSFVKETSILYPIMVSVVLLIGVGVIIMATS